MIRMLVACLVALAWLAAPGAAPASGPVPVKIVGCVKEGLFISLEVKFLDNPERPPMPGFHGLRLPREVDLSRLEGRRVVMEGALLPGDRFTPGPGAPADLGPCPTEHAARLAQATSAALAALARGHLEAGQLEQAEDNLRRAVGLDPQPCHLYLLRADLHDRTGRPDQAIADARLAVDKGCRRYPDLEALARRLAAAGKRAEAADTYEAAARVCEYPPDRARLNALAAGLR